MSRRTAIELLPPNPIGWREEVAQYLERNARSPEELKEAIRILERNETRDALRRLRSTKKPVGKRTFGAAILFLAYYKTNTPPSAPRRRGRPPRSFSETACYTFLDDLFRKHVSRPCGEAVRLMLSATFGIQNWDLVKMAEEAEQRIGRPRKKFRT